MGNGKQKRFGTRRGWYHSMVAAVALAFFGVSVAAFADTYNFYFSKGKKKQQQVEQHQNDADTEKTVEDAESSESESGRRANGNVPIIINNNVGGKGFTPPDSSSYRPEESDESRPPAKPTNRDGTVSTTMAPKDDFQHFRFGLSAVRWDERGWDALPAAGAPIGITAGGVVATLGFDFTRAAGINVFLGSRENAFQLPGNDPGRRMFLGADFQFTPFRLNVGSFDLLELGFLAGTSTIYKSGFDKLVDPEQFHLGARFNINLGSSFGITTVARATAKYTMAEVGLVARL